MIGYDSHWIFDKSIITLMQRTSATRSSNRAPNLCSCRASNFSPRGNYSNSLGHMVHCVRITMTFRLKVWNPDNAPLFRNFPRVPHCRCLQLRARLAAKCATTITAVTLHFLIRVTIPNLEGIYVPEIIQRFPNCRLK